MAWDDRTSFEAIRTQFGLTPGEVITPVTEFLTSVMGWTDRHIVYASSGIVAVDVENASSPTLMPAHLSTWQRQMIRVGDTLIIAAGRSGIVQL